MDEVGLSKTPTIKLQNLWKKFVGKSHTKSDLHHGFPEEYSNDLKELADIDVNDPKYFYNIDKKKHTKSPGIHTNSSRTGQSWNKTWRGIINQVKVKNSHLSKAEKKKILESILRSLARKERISKYNGCAAKNRK